MKKVNYKLMYNKNYFTSRPDLNSTTTKGHFYHYGIWLTKKLKFNSVLDVGCGYGHLTNILYKLKKVVRGVDISSFVIKEAKQLYPDVPFSISELPFLSNIKEKYDLVICYHTLEHIKDIDAKKAVQRLIDLSNKYCVIVVPLLDIPGREGYADLTHLCVKPTAWWEQIITDNGGKLLNVSYDPPHKCDFVFEKE